MNPSESEEVQRWQDSIRAVPAPYAESMKNWQLSFYSEKQAPFSIEVNSAEWAAKTKTVCFCFHSGPFSCTARASMCQLCQQSTGAAQQQVKNKITRKIEGLGKFNQISLSDDGERVHLPWKQRISGTLSFKLRMAESLDAFSCLTHSCRPITRGFGWVFVQKSTWICSLILLVMSDVCKSKSGGVTSPGENSSAALWDHVTREVESSSSCTQILRRRESVRLHNDHCQS